MRVSPADQWQPRTRLNAPEHSPHAGYAAQKRAPAAPPHQRNISTVGGGGGHAVHPAVSGQVGNMPERLQAEPV